MVEDLRIDPNPAVKHDGPGVFGVTAGNEFYLTLQANPGFDERSTALGRVVAGAHVLADLAAGDGIQRIRILRGGESARSFDTSDETFGELLSRGR